MAQKQDHFLTVQEFYSIRKSKNLFVSIESIGIISKKKHLFSRGVFRTLSNVYDGPSGKIVSSQMFDKLLNTALINKSNTARKLLFLKKSFFTGLTMKYFWVFISNFKQFSYI